MENSGKIKLQGHEKFTLREGWLNKGLVEVSKNSAIFLKKDATDVFGIGSNMVKSLRYWMKALGLIDAKTGEVTELGNIIYENDPYFENIFTLWLLHSHIVKNSEEATAWYIFFNYCDIDELDKEQIVQIMIRELKKYNGDEAFNEKSLRNDVDVLVGMYGKARNITDPEDKNNSPFSQLGLIKFSDGKYSKIQPDGRIFSEWILMAELAQRLEGKAYISIDEIAVGKNSMSSIYQISDIMINEFLDRLDAMGLIRVDRTAGLDVIYNQANMSQGEVITQYYRTHR